jgi:hypothetical protein
MTLVNDIHRFDIISDQIERMKKMVMNMIILMRNLGELGQVPSNIQVIRHLSMEMTDIFQNYRELSHMSLESLTRDEIQYINDSTNNFLRMMLHTTS